MKKIYDKELKVECLYPETVEEAINELQEFFEADMWYTKHAEWKTEKDMLEYLKTHFDILRKEIKKIKNGKNKK